MSRTNVSNAVGGEKLDSCTLLETLGVWDVAPHRITLSMVGIAGRNEQGMGLDETDGDDGLSQVPPRR